MAMKYKQVGGEPSGVGKDYSDLLQSLLTGSFGAAGATSQAANANPVASTGGISDVLRDILSGGAGKIGGAMATQIGQQQTRDVDALRARFGAGGGAAFGTPASSAEAIYRANVAPQITTAIGGLQENLLNQLFPQYADIYNRTTPQASTVGVQNPWIQGLGLATQAAGAIAPFFGGFGGMGSIAGTGTTAGAGAGYIPSWAQPMNTNPYNTSGLTPV